MDFLSAYLNVPVFAMVASRLGGLIMFQPVLSSLAVPTNLRVMFVLGLAMLVTPFVHLGEAAPTTPGGMALAIGGEIALGMLIGVIVMTGFIGLQMGGQLIAQQSGLAFGRIADPSTGTEQTVLSVFYIQLGAVAYLIFGGHRAVVTACLDTFETIPLLGDRDGSIDLALLIDALTLGLEVSIRIAAPAVITVYLVNIALGFISRTVPQLNIATVGFSLKSLIAFVIMAVSLPTAMTVFTDQLEEIVDWIDTIARQAGTARG